MVQGHNTWIYRKVFVPTPFMHSKRQAIQKDKNRCFGTQQAFRTLESSSQAGEILTGWPSPFNRKIGSSICVSPISVASQVLSKCRIVSSFQKEIIHVILTIVHVLLWLETTLSANVSSQKRSISLHVQDILSS